MIKLEIIRNTMIPGRGEGGKGLIALVGTVHEFEDDDINAYRIMNAGKAKLVEGKNPRKKMSAKAQEALIGSTTAKV